MKSIYLLGAFALALTFGCNSAKEEKVIESKSVETVKVVEVEAPAKEEEEKEEGTTIKVGPDGGSVKTKNVEVEVKE